MVSQKYKIDFILSSICYIFGSFLKIIKMLKDLYKYFKPIIIELIPLLVPKVLTQKLLFRILILIH
jgi:hypothetical protein